MNRLRDKWADLGPRLTSAIVMVVIGFLAILISPYTFIALVVFALAIGIWELFSMWRAKTVGGTQPENVSFPDFFALSGYALLACLGGLGLIVARMVFGVSGVLFVVGLVVVTDTMGYFAGKSIGGPKFWPAISPKKTWAGIVGGWIGAALLTLLVMPVLPDVVALLGGVLGAVAISFASQLGDIAQSAVKRRMGVKDSSNIIPGHGGVLDRFDALLAVGVVIVILAVMGS